MTTTTHEFQVRVRPPRIAVVISTHTTTEDFLQTIQFLSMVRGGKFARFIYADMTIRKFSEIANHLQTESKEFQPEIVIGASEEDRANINPFFSRKSRPMLVEIPKDFYRNFKEHYTGVELTH